MPHHQFILIASTFPYPIRLRRSGWPFRRRRSPLKIISRWVDQPSAGRSPARWAVSAPADRFWRPDSTGRRVLIAISIVPRLGGIRPARRRRVSPLTRRVRSTGGRVRSSRRRIRPGRWRPAARRRAIIPPRRRRRVASWRRRVLSRRMIAVDRPPSVSVLLPRR
jgi:hypothetical protein